VVRGWFSCVSGALRGRKYSKEMKSKLGKGRIGKRKPDDEGTWAGFAITWRTIVCSILGKVRPGLSKKNYIVYAGTLQNQCRRGGNNLRSDAVSSGQMSSAEIVMHQPASVVRGGQVERDKRNGVAER